DCLEFAGRDGSVNRVSKKELPRITRVDFMENQGNTVVYGKGFLVNGDLWITSKKSMNRQEFSKVAEKEVNPALAASFRKDELRIGRPASNPLSLGALLRPRPSFRGPSMDIS